MPDVIARLREDFERRGHLAYGEVVDLREHMLQSAYFAECQGAEAALVTAALLHDYGHLVAGLPEDAAAHGVDGRHEEIGAAALAGHFPARIIEAIRLHVEAKRYLCARNPAYHERLSAASVETLALQGGPMTAAEIEQFEARPGYREAVALRTFDDRGKQAALDHPGLDHYLEIARGCLHSS